MDSGFLRVFCGGIVLNIVRLPGPDSSQSVICKCFYTVCSFFFSLFFLYYFEASALKLVNYG